MNDFNALLKRSFAEADEPADDGFTVAVTHNVARHEAAAAWRNRAYAVCMGVAGLAVFYGVYALASALGPQLMAQIGLELAQANGALASGPSPAGQGVLSSLGAGMSQVLLIMATLAGGAVAFRSVRQG
ncbi:MAG TPA: hypothetical protein PLK37_09605 [Terricaulis sp.]|nr:hypothetical protein [Terricaulis sp.]